MQTRSAVSMRSIGLFGLCFAVSLIPAAPAYAASVVASPTAITVMARSANGTSILPISIDACTFSTTGNFFQWQPAGPIVMADPTNGATIATIRTARLRLYIGNAPRITLDLSADAGAAATSFTITPAALMFGDGIPRRMDVRARASLGTRDLDGDIARLRTTGDTGSGMFIAALDSPVPWGLPFASLLASMAALGPFAEVGVAQSEPSTGDYQALPFPIRSLHMQLGFNLTANDRVTIATNYQTRVGLALHVDADDLDEDKNGDEFE